MRGANYSGNCSGFDQLLIRSFQMNTGSGFCAGCADPFAGEPAPTRMSQPSKSVRPLWERVHPRRGPQRTHKSNQCTLLVHDYRKSHRKSALFAINPPPDARKRPLLSRPRHFRALACNLLPCEAGKLGRLSAPGNTLFPGQRPTAL